MPFTFQGEDLPRKQKYYIEVLLLLSKMYHGFNVFNIYASYDPDVDRKYRLEKRRYSGLVGWKDLGSVTIPEAAELIREHGNPNKMTQVFSEEPHTSPLKFGLSHINGFDGVNVKRALETQEMDRLSRELGDALQGK